MCILIGYSQGLLGLLVLEPLVLLVQVILGLLGLMVLLVQVILGPLGTQVLLDQQGVMALETPLLG